MLVCRGCKSKVPQTRGLNHRNLFLIALEARIPKIKVLAGLVFPEAILLCLQRATFSLGPRRVLPLCLSHVIRVLVRLDYGPVL